MSYYQIVTHRKVGLVLAHSRSNSTSDINVARTMYEAALEAYGTEDMAVEHVTCLVSENWSDLDEQYRRFTQGLPCHTIDFSPDATRLTLEMAPLKNEYPDPVVKNRYRFDLFSKEEMRGYIDLMRRFRAGTVGGKDDGAE